MSQLELGQLERIDLRLAWAHEAHDFTPWLALPENLALLSEAIGLDLEWRATEEAVGDFSADILAADSITGQLVLIENQLEQTNHTHLGQILTYAAGLSAHTVVWIAKEFREPHRAAIDFLNQISSEDYNFFAVQLELYRIGNSPAAPEFNLVAKPNDWSKRIAGKAAKNVGALNSSKREWVDYWTAFLTSEAVKPLELGSRVAPREGWFRVQTLRSGNATAAIWLHWSKGNLRVVLWLGGPFAKQLFDALRMESASIDTGYSDALVWDDMPGRKTSMVIEQGPHPESLSDTEAFTWFVERAGVMEAIFAPLLATISDTTFKVD